MNNGRILAVVALFVLMTPTVVASGNDSYYIFDNELQINEGIVIETSVHIEVVEVKRFPLGCAKFRITSYQKPERMMTVFTEDGPQANRYGTYSGASIYLDVIGVYSDSVEFRIAGPSNWRVTDYYDVEPDEEGEATVAVTVPKLEITRTLGTASAEQGQTIEVTLTIKNTGNGSAKSITLDEPKIRGTFQDEYSSTIDDISAGETRRVKYDLKIMDAEPGTYELVPAILNYKSDTDVSYSSESQSSVLTIEQEEVLLPLLEVSIESARLSGSADATITCGDRFPVTITIANVGNATTERVNVKTDLPGDVRVVDGESEPVYDAIKPGEDEEYEITMIATDEGKHTIEVRVMWADSEATADLDFWAEKSGLEKYYLYVLAAVPILLLLLWSIKKHRDYSY